MKRALIVVVLFTAVLNAKNACGAVEASGFSKALLGAPAPMPVQDDRLCQEYVLRSEGLYYRIRSRDGRPAAWAIGRCDRKLSPTASPAELC